MKLGTQSSQQNKRRKNKTKFVNAHDFWRMYVELKFDIDVSVTNSNFVNSSLLTSLEKEYSSNATAMKFVR